MKPDDAEKPALLSDRMSYADFFKSRTELTKIFCETAKSYIQISSAALALPLLFSQAIFGESVAKQGFQAGRAIWILFAAWLSFLLSIGFGLLYQWLITRKLWDTLHRHHLTEENANEWGFRITPWVWQLERVNRSAFYGAMIAFFYLGAILFVLFAARTIMTSWPR
jgi:hypothetical protein